MRSREVRLVVVVALVTLLPIVSCGTTASDDEILVLAASSLTGAFAEMEEAFEATNPDIDVLVSYGGSSALREQILAGAPAHVFASASSSVMRELVASGVPMGDPVVFARNHLSLAVPSGNPGGVEGLGDLASASLFVSLCSPAVPCGDLAEEALAMAGVDPQVDSLEPNVKSLLAKIESGEADTGLVYVTDVRASADVEEVMAGLSDGPFTEYPIVSLAQQGSTSHGERFVEFVLSPAGLAILAAHGFVAP